jgi:prophage DNA circulation protein
MTDIISGLAELTWRPDSFSEALRAPCGTASFEFSHSLPERSYPYVDGKGHDWTGRDPIPLPARLFFLNTLEPASFPENWNDWQPALFTGEAGDLVHPILGLLRARVQRGSVTLAAEERSGVVLDVSWIETLDDPAELFFFGELSVIEVNLSSRALAAEAAAKAFGVTYTPGVVAAAFTPSTTPTKPSFPTAEAHTTLVSAVAELQSYAVASSGAAAAVSLATQLAGRVNQMVRDVEDLRDPEAWPAYDNLVATWTMLRDLERRLEKKQRPTARRQLGTATTLDAFADSVSNNLGEIVSLNPHALGHPLVEKGVFLRYYTGNS